MDWKKPVTLMIFSLFLGGCWFIERKTVQQQQSLLPPMPAYKNKVVVQVADFQNETGHNFLNYLEKTMVPYLREYLSQLKRIRIKKEFQSVTNVNAIKAYFSSKHSEREKHRDIIFKILNQDEIPERFLDEEMFKKRQELKKKILQEEEAARLRLEQQNTQIQRFSTSDEALRIKQEIQNIKEEIEKKILEAQQRGQPYSTEEMERLRKDPRIIELELVLESRALEQGSSQREPEPIIKYATRFNIPNDFFSSVNQDDYYVNRSLALNHAEMEKLKKLQFLGLRLSEYDESTAITSDFEVSEKRLVLERFNYNDVLSAGASMASSQADYVITGKLGMSGDKLKITVIGYDKNSNKFLFNISEEFSLSVFELEIQSKLRNISKKIINELSRMPTAPLLVRSNSEFSIVYLNNRDVGRTETGSRGSEYTELFIPAVPIGYNFIEIVKRGYYPEKGYIFIQPGDRLHTVDITLKPIFSGNTLKIFTQPENATVYVDLDLITGSPFIAKNLQAGMHKITVSAPGYQTRRLSYEVIQGINNVITISLDKIDAQQTPPEVLAKRYNFAKNFFFLSGAPFLGGMLFTSLMSNYYNTKASQAIYKASSLSGSQQTYWLGIANKSNQLYSTYLNQSNFFQVGLGTVFIMAGIFQYLESKTLDRDNIGYNNLIRRNRVQFDYLNDLVFQVSFDF